MSRFCLYPLVHLLLLSAAVHVPLYALTPSRSLSWGTEAGNLLPNWSFENSWQGWENGTPQGTTVDLRYKLAGAPSGSYVAASIGTTNTATAASRIVSGLIPCQAGTALTFSVQYQATGIVGGSAWPLFQYYSDRTTVLSQEQGSIYLGTGGWFLHVDNIYPPDGALFVKVTLLQSTGSGVGGPYYFDNAILQYGTYSSTQIQDMRNRITESVAFGDGFGRTLQQNLKLQSGKYLVGGSGYDAWARPDLSYLPTPVFQAAPTFLTDLPAKAAAYYNGAANNGPDAGGFPYSQAQFAEEIGARAVAGGGPGAPWALTGKHADKQGYFYSSSLAFLPANIENPASDVVERDYRVDWARDADSNFTFTWTNRQGHVVQTATHLTRGGASAATWTLAKTQYEYFPNGQLKRVRTPLDAQGGTLNFSEVSESNTLGLPVSEYTKSRGLTRYWYNRGGALRYSQDSGEALQGRFRYREYDSQGRLVSEGMQALASMSQDIADQDSYPGGTKTEEVGYIYDDLSGFQTRTGFPLGEIMPYYYYLQGIHSQGRMVCAYHRNTETSAPGYGSKDKFVADFYDYDARGNVVKALKSVMPIRDADRKFQDSYFYYDETNRLVESKNYQAAVSSTLSTRHVFTYDSLGRLSKVLGLTDKPLVKFTYLPHGSLKQVILGGDGAGTKGTKVEYFYNVRGWVSEIRATDLLNAKVVYQQYLGYNAKSNSASTVPAQGKPLFAGPVTQQLYRFAKDVESLNPVRMVNYDYDALGRMIRADGRKNSNSQPFYSDGTVNFPTLAWTNNQDLDSYLEYDLNGRTLGQRTGGVSSADSARYAYQPNSYLLDHVDGKVSDSISRYMGTPGTFAYDASGRMTYDGSKYLYINHNPFGQPALFTSYAGPERREYEFYDARGNRAYKLFYDFSQFQGTAYLNGGSAVSKEWKETLNASTGAVVSTSETVNLFGNSQLGRIRPGGVYEFYLKNNQGSTMKTVSDMGGEPGGGSASFDYMAYGDIRKLKESGTPVTEKYTGKEYDDLFRLYYFGARWLDPELGVWMSPDPAGQYSNPYSYVGGDVVNMYDPDGRTGVYVNGIGGRRSPDFEIAICAELGSEYCGTQTASSRGTKERSAFWADNYFGTPGRDGNPNPWIHFPLDGGIAALPLHSIIPGVQAYSGIARAIRHSNGKPVHVVSTSGGNGSGAWGVAFANAAYGYGSVSDHTSYSPGPNWHGRTAATITGTRNSSYYNVEDYPFRDGGAYGISYLGAVADKANPITSFLDPIQNMNALNLDRWCLDNGPNSGHDPKLNCRTVNDMMKDRVWGYEGVAHVADQVTRGAGNYFWENVSPINHLMSDYRSLVNLNPNDGGDYYRAWKQISPVGRVYKDAGNVIDWVGSW